MMGKECDHHRLDVVGDRSTAYRQLFESMQEGFAVHEIICDESNQPIDYRFIDVNPAFELLTGFNRDCLLGRTVKEVMPSIEPYWIQRYGQVALAGEPKRFEAFTKEIGRHYSIYAYSPGPKMFATLFNDVTERVQAEEKLRKANESLEEKVRIRTNELYAVNQELTAHNEEVRAMNEELTAQNEEVIAMSKEIDSLNQSLIGMNVILERRVLERTSDLSAAHQELTAQLEELEKVNETVRAQEERFRKAINFAPFPLMIHAEDGEVLQINKAWTAKSGYSFEDIPTTAEWTFKAYGERRDQVLQDIEALFQIDGILEEGEYRIKNKNGEIRTWAFSSAPLERLPDGRRAVMSMAMDVTERKVLENELVEAKAFLNAAMDQSQAGIAIADAVTGNLRYVNDAGLMIRGGRREEIVNGVGVDQYVNSWRIEALDGRPLQREEVPLARAILYDEKASREMVVRNANDESRIVLASAAPIKDPEGKIIAGMVVFLDITEQKRAEAKIQRNAQIQEILREIAEAAFLLPSVSELFPLVHQLVKRVLPTEMLHISFLDEATGEIVVPYRAKEAPFIPDRRPITKGLTEYFLRLGRAAHLKPDDLAKLRETGEYTLGTVQNVHVQHYLGAPLINLQGKSFGLLSVALMDDSQAFQTEDVEMLSIIATQVSMAIERKNTWEAMLESEARYRAVLEQSPEAVMLCDPGTGEIIEVNSRFTERLGYDLQRHGRLNLLELIVDAPENIQTNMNNVSENEILPVQRRIFKHRNGSYLNVERSARLVSYQGRKLAVMTLRDVSDEVRREQEIRRDAELATRVQNALLSVPEPSEYLEIATIYRPFSYVGGDLYFIDWRYGGNLLRGFLVDATGHGLGTALHTASLHVLLREVNELDLTLSETMRWLNRRAGQYFDEGTFAGTLAFELDLQTRQLRWTCAGIPKIWVSTKTEQGVRECPGMSLGINKEETFDRHTMVIDIGDTFYFMTDGLSDLMLRQTQLPLEKFSETVGLLKKLSEAENCRDDATAVCIHVRAMPQSIVREDGWPRIIRFSGYGDYQRFKGEVGSILAEVTGKLHSLQEVAVHEALANALECRDGQSRHQKARIKFNKVGIRLIVRVKTSRIGFAGNAILKRLRSHPEDMFSFGEDASMGRGIPMMLSMAHKMTYNSEGTEVLLAWRLVNKGEN